MAITMVLGASEKPHRYSNMAVLRLVEKGQEVIAVGRRAGHIGSVPIITTIPDGVAIDTVTVYLSRRNQEEWIAQLQSISPRRVILNPGAENPALERVLSAQGVEVLHACTLVMLGTGAY